MILRKRRKLDGKRCVLSIGMVDGRRKEKVLMIFWFQVHLFKTQGINTFLRICLSVLLGKVSALVVPIQSSQ